MHEALHMLGSDIYSHVARFVTRSIESCVYNYELPLQLSTSTYMCMCTYRFTHP